MIEIRPATSDDQDGVWEIFHQVVASGDTYVFPRNSDRKLFTDHWLKYEPIVAVEGERIIGTYILKKNQIGLGSHVANASYMVHPEHHGKGIGKQLGLHSIDFAREQGFKAIQFNIVVVTNKAAVALWKKLGFRIIGTTPKAFNHSVLGYVDAHIMYREL